MKRLARRFWSNEEGAIAPTLALALFALIAAGGIAFDYARMAALDTELQNAADQAALAAVGQLDQSDGSRNRATAAAQDLVENLTLLANDGGGTAVDVPTVEFYSTYLPNRANLSDAPGTAATTDATAHYVRVTVETRAANFALTPIVAMLSSGPLSARALAGLGSATCNLPPVMICNPFEPLNNPDPNFPFNANSLRGFGLKLVDQGGSGGWSPGNFGYLDDPNTDNGTPGVRAALGWETIPGGCSGGAGVTTETGVATTVTDALNTRFDIRSNQGCPVGGTCRPSRNSAKDLVHAADASGNPNMSGANACQVHGNQGWTMVASAGQYLPPNTTPLPVGPVTGANNDLSELQTMGHPRDLCHAVATPTCGQIGDGSWDRNAYFYVNHGSSFDWEAAMNAAYGTTSVSRYQVYLWELDGHMPAARAVAGKVSLPAATCTAPGLSPPADRDRRKISAAIINCDARDVNGMSTNVRVLSWIDMFLVEPSFDRDRTDAGDIYVEIIGETPQGGGGAPLGPISRNVPRILE
jgi:Flp pilus assembly protein TadG